MPEWEDYYEILQIPSSAKPKVIKAAYRELAKKHHPDKNKKNLAAEERMKKINVAYDVLSNPEKRKEYDLEWHRKKGATSSWAKTSTFPKPKPVVDPPHIKFDPAEPGKTQTASFVVKNIGGPYTKIWISNPDSWVRLVRYFSLTDSDELPLRIEIEAEGEDWGKSYSEYIRIKLDEEEIRVKIELQTKPEPIRENVRVGGTPKAKPTPPPSSTVSGDQILRKRVFGLVAIVAIALVSPTIFGWLGDNFSSEPSYDEVVNSADMWIKQNPYLPTPKPLILKRMLVDVKVVGKHAWATMKYDCDPKIFGNSTNRSYIRCHYTLSGGYIYGLILHSSDSGRTWELQMKDGNVIMGAWMIPLDNGLKFINEKEGYAAGDFGILYTNDSGKHWEYLNLPSKMGYISEVKYIEDYHLVVIGSSSNWDMKYESFDGGKTWQKITETRKTNS